jgi:hypothetical protein
MKGANRTENITSRKLPESKAQDEQDILDKQLKQLKLIKTHMESINGEVITLSQTDDDDAGGSL